MNRIVQAKLTYRPTKSLCTKYKYLQRKPLFKENIICIKNTSSQINNLISRIMNRANIESVCGRFINGKIGCAIIGFVMGYQAYSFFNSF